MSSRTNSTFSHIEDVASSLASENSKDKKER